MQNQTKATAFEQLTLVAVRPPRFWVVNRGPLYRRHLGRGPNRATCLTPPLSAERQKHPPLTWLGARALCALGAGQYSAAETAEFILFDSFRGSANLRDWGQISLTTFRVALDMLFSSFSWGA